MSRCSECGCVLDHERDLCPECDDPWLTGEMRFLMSDEPLVSVGFMVGFALVVILIITLAFALVLM